MSGLRQEVVSGTVAVEHPSPLEFGGRLEHLEVGFRLYGDVKRPLVVALGGISAGRHIAACADEPRRGWWEDFVGERLAVDRRRYSVLGIDWLGGSGASTGPGRGEQDGATASVSSVADDAGAHQHGESLTCAPFPSIGTRDQAQAITAVLDHLGVRQAHAIVGASYGGMVALSCAVNFPERVERAVVISAAHRTHPMATALRSLQRGIVRLGLETGRVTESLRIARGVAMTTYRTAEEFRERFDAEARWSPAGARFPVEEYLDHSGRRFAESFSAESFLCLSESIDLHWIDPSAVRTPVTLVAVSSDTLVPMWQMAELRDALRVDAQWHGVDSIYGHDAFLKEVPAISTAIRAAIR